MHRFHSRAKQRTAARRHTSRASASAQTLEALEDRRLLSVAPAINVFTAGESATTFSSPTIGQTTIPAGRAVFVHALDTPMSDATKLNSRFQWNFGDTGSTYFDRIDRNVWARRAGTAEAYHRLKSGADYIDVDMGTWNGYSQVGDDTSVDYANHGFNTTTFAPSSTSVAATFGREVDSNTHDFTGCPRPLTSGTSAVWSAGAVEAASQTVPSAPTNLTASAVSSSQINLAWTDTSNNETGFQIERKTGSGSYAVVATVGAGVTSYSDIGLTSATTYFYQVRSTNGAGASAPSSSASATTQAAPPPSGTIKVNFQTATSATPAGYLADAGVVFANRGNGYSYGWNVTTYTSDRNHTRSPDQRYDTQAHTQKNGNISTWEIGLPNGMYSVRLVAGDPSAYDSTYKFNLEGVVALDAVPNGNNYWIESTTSVTASDGKLTLSNAAGSANNKIAFLDIAPLNQMINVNFQTAASATPSGYVGDTGAVYADRGNGYSYGWNATTYTTDRDHTRSPDQRYDTQAHTQKNGANGIWEVGLANGSYTVKLVAGDPSAYDSVYKFNLEGVLALNGTPNGSNYWIESTATVTVSDGRLTLSNATGSSNNKISFLEITRLS